MSLIAVVWRIALGAACLAGLSWSGAARADAAPPGTATLLKPLFDAAWARQPEALAQAGRDEEAALQAQVAAQWLPGPPALTLAHKSGQGRQGQGQREQEISVSAPLWLPGEQDQALALAATRAQALSAARAAAQLRTAQAIRTAYWDWQRAVVNVRLAQARLHAAQELAADTARRVRAGDLAPLDQLQADGLVASAEAEWAAAQGAEAAARRQVEAHTGLPLPADVGMPAPEPEPDSATLAPAHARLQEAGAHTETARQAAALAARRAWANPELSLSTSRERDQTGAPWQRAISLNLRLPLGEDGQQRAQAAALRAEAAEAQARWQQEQARLAAEMAAAADQLAAARAQLQATARHERTAAQARALIAHSFRLGESGMAERLRAERDAHEAATRAASVRIEEAAALSSLRQALGLLPE